MGKIFLNKLEFYAFHGVLKEENTIGGKYILDIELTTDISKAGISDNLNDTVDYSQVYNCVADEMKKSSKLIEHVGSRIVDVLLHTFPVISGVKLILQKVKPPIKGDLFSVGVEIFKER